VVKPIAAAELSTLLTPTQKAIDDALDALYPKGRPLRLPVLDMAENVRTWVRENKHKGVTISIRMVQDALTRRGWTRFKRKAQPKKKTR
jgi:hypothetical protein